MVHPGEYLFNFPLYSMVQYVTLPGLIVYWPTFARSLIKFKLLIQKIDLHGIRQYKHYMYMYMYVFYNSSHSLTVNSSFIIVIDLTCYTVHVYTQFQGATVYNYICMYSCIQKFLTSSLRFKCFGHPRRLCWSIGMPSCISSIRLIVPRNLIFSKW